MAGYVEKESDLITAKAVLENDIGGLASVRYDVETRNDRMETLRRRLDNLGFEHRLHIQHLEGGSACSVRCRQTGGRTSSLN